MNHSARHPFVVDEADRLLGMPEQLQPVQTRSLQNDCRAMCSREHRKALEISDRMNSVDVRRSFHPVFCQTHKPLMTNIKGLKMQKQTRLC